jgi:hypothetical protein
VLQSFGDGTFREDPQNGDVNGDGAIDITDVIDLRGWIHRGNPSHLAEFSVYVGNVERTDFEAYGIDPKTGAEVALLNGDVNGDGNIDNTDVRVMYQGLFLGNESFVEVAGIRQISSQSSSSAVDSCERVVQPLGDGTFRGNPKNGDVNADGFRDLTDARNMLSYLFLGQGEIRDFSVYSGGFPSDDFEPYGFGPDGQEVALQNGDVNGDEHFDMTDAVCLLRWRLLGDPSSLVEIAGIRPSSN